jgi:VCBS repeat-containing protein
MNASSFRRRFTLLFAALSLTPLLANAAPVSMDFKVLIDADNREATGCTVVTTSGLVKGVDHVLTTSVSYDSAAGTASVTGVTRQTCTDSVGNSFSAPIPVDTTGWPVGVSADGSLFIETHIPMSALGGVTNMHLAFTAASGTFADAVTIDPEGERIIWPPIVHHRHAAGDALARHIILDGISTDWDGLEPIAEGGKDAAPQLRFLNLRTFMNETQLYFAISVQSNANAPTANDDNYSVERGKSLGISVPGVLANDTDPNHKSLIAKLIASTQHGTLTLNADGSFNYQNDGSAAPLDSFEYKANNGTADSNAAHVTINVTEPNPGPPPVKPQFTSPNTTTFCVGTAKTFTITTTPFAPFVTVTKQSGTLPNGLTFSATPNSGTGQIAGTAAVGTGGTYNLVFQATNAVGSTPQNFTLIVSEPAPPAITPASPQTCAGSIGNTATGPAGASSYSWSITGGTITAGQTSQTVTWTAGAAGTATLTLTVTNAGGCPKTNSANVTVNQIPATPTASNGGPYCPGATISLSTPAVAGATYSWTGPNGFTSALQNPTRANATVADGGTYSVTITVNGCTSAAGTTNVVVNPTPATPAASNGGPYCPGQTISLSTPAVAGATYAWTGPNGFTSTLQNPTRANATTADAGSYSVTITVNGCPSAAGSTSVVVNPTPATPTASNGGPYCVGATISLSTPAVAGATYSWTGPNGFTSTQQNPTRANATLADAGTYSVTVTVAGCPSAAGSTNVVVNPTPATPTASNGGPYCPGQTISLSTPLVAGAAYSWTGPNGFTSTLQNPTRANATTADAGTYSVTITVSGCPSAPGTTNVVVNPTPATPTASNGGPYCPGATIALSTPTVAGATYSWTGPNGFTSTLQNPTRSNATAADAGTYSVTITVNSCPSSAGSTNVVVNPTPATPTASNGGPYCVGATISLSTPAVASATYSWTGPNGFTSSLQNPTRANATLADAGTYSVTVTVSGCPSAAGTTNVVVNPTPATPTASNGGPYCPGQTISLSTPLVAGATYSWTGPNGFTSALQNPTRANATTADAGTYSVTITVSGCPSAAGTTNVVVNPTPATPTASDGGPYCVGATISLSTPTVAGASYSWTGPNGFTSSLQNPTRTNATTADAGTYSVTITVAGCPSAAGSTNVVVNPIPATPAATNGGPYCENATISLSTPLVAGATYSWTGPNGFTSSQQNPTIPSATLANAGTYSVTVTVSGCTSAAGTTDVVINPTPATPAASNDGPHCPGQTIALSTPLVAGATYAWTGPNGFTSALQNPTVPNATTADAGTYSVTVTVSGCTSAAGTTDVVVNATPATPAASNGGPYCVGSTITLSTPAVSGATYSWTGPNGFTSTLQNPTRANATLADAGTYSVTVTVNACPSAAGTTNVVVNANPATPTITPGGPTTFCAGGSVTLTAPGGFSYSWSTGATTQSILVTTSGSYTVTVTDGNGCSAASAPTVVTVNPNPATPTITPGGPTTFCAGGSVTLTAPNGFTYLWSTTETTQSIVVSASGSYTVTVTDGNGCSATSAPTTVTVNPNPATPAITPGGPTTFCTGGSVTLTAPNGFTYLWSTNETTQSILVSTSGSYTVTVTDGNGCSATSAPTVVTVNPNPTTPVITPSGPTTFCAGGSVTLTAPAGFTYLWSTTETTQSIVVSTAGSYTVTVTDGNGCTATSAPTTVTVNSNPSTPTITPGGPTTFCAGGSVTLTAPGGFTYSWSTGATTQSIVVSTSGSYTVTVSDGNGCSATSAPTTVTVNPNPATPTITPSGPTTFCAGGNVNLTAPGGFTYMWSTGATTQAINVTTSGSFTVTVTNGNGCSSTSAPTTVTVNPNPSTPVITPSGPTTFCAGGSVTLNAPGGFTYMWSTGATTQSINVTASGSFTVTVTDGNGCSATSAPTTVTVNPNPSTPAITPSPASVCASSIGNTASGPAGATTYSWSITNGVITAGQTSQTVTYTAGASGQVGLTLTVTNANGCFASNSANVTINANPAAPAITPSPAQVCANSIGNSASGPAGATTYSWSIVNGSITAGQTSQTVTYTAGASGTVDLTLVVTNGAGCSASNGTSVTINPSPSTPTVTPSSSGVCAGSTGNTASGPAGATTYSWSITNGSITSATNIQTVTWTAGVAGTTTLTLTVTNGSGCPATGNANVVVNANPSSPTITPAQSPVCPNSTGNTASGPGGATTYAWSITGGSITSATNIQTITYTAGASGQVGLTLVVTNAAGCSASNTLNVNISSAITPARNGGGAFPAGTIATAYAGQSFTASGGTGPYTFAVTGGTFPTNLTLASNGTISGTPTATGTFLFTVTATDASNCTGAASFSIAINPSAGGDSYSSLVDNTQAYVQGGTTTAPATPAVALTGSILSNDLPAGGVAAVAGTVTSSAALAAGGSNNVTIAADGTFKYTPPARPGQAALTSDTFTYTITSNTGGTATPTQATGTVTLTLAGRVWYVKNNAAGGGNGQSQSPFNSLGNFTNAARVTPDVAGDIIFVYNGDGTTTNYNAGVKLLANEQLIGEGVALVVNSNTLVAAGTKPQITNTAGDGVTLNNGNTVKGITVTGASSNDINGTNTNGLTIDTVTATSAGAAASALVLTSPSNTITITNTTLSNSPFELTINGGTANFTMNNTNTITANAGQRSINFANLGGASIVNVGAAITDGGIGMTVSSSAAGAVVNFTGTQTLGTTTNAAVTLSGNNATSVISFTGTLAITTSTGTGFSAGTGTLNVAGTANITTGAAPAALSLNTVTVGASGVTFNSVNATGPTTGISVVNTTNATAVIINGGTINNAGTGVTMQGASTNLTLTNVTIGGTTTTGITNTANFGTLTGNNLAVSAVTALNLTGGTLAGSWGNVSSSGGVNGVSLNNVAGSFSTTGGTLTGASGSTFKVVGGTSGTIGWAGAITQANGALVVDISGANNQTINFTGNVQTSATGTGISLASTGAAPSYNFSGGTNTIAGSGGGVTIGSGQAGTITFTSGTSITTAATSFKITGSPSAVTANITYSGTISQTTNGGTVIDINSAAGTYSGTLLMNGTSVSGSSNGNNGVLSVIKNATGSVTINNFSETANNNNYSNTLVAISGSTGTLTFNHLTLQATGTGHTGKGLTMTGGGTLAITATGGASSIDVSSTALDLNGVAIAASTIATVNSSGGVNGVLLTGCSPSSGGTLTLTAGTISGQTGSAFKVLNGSANASFGGTITQNTAAQLAVDISGITNGTIGFSGAITSNGGAGVSAAGTGGTVSFTGGMTLNGTGSRFAATGSGMTVNVTGTNTVGGTTAVTSGIAVNITCTIGGSGVTFQKISSTGATSGIVLSNTGSGNFTVTGNAGTCNSAANCTGGAIQSSTGPGINLTSATGAVSLSFVDVESGADDGIRGNVVGATGSGGFTLASCRIVNNGNATTERGIELTNVRGNGGISNSTVTGNAEDNLWIQNSSGTLASFNVTGSTFSNTSTSIGNDGIHLEGIGTAAMTASITGCTFNHNRGDHFQVTTDAVSSATINATFSSNTLTGDRGTTYGGSDLGGSITINPGGTANVTVTLSSNNITGATSSAITLDSSNSSQIHATVTSNIIGTAGTVDSGSSQGDGISVFAINSSTLHAVIQNNTIKQYSNANGIDIKQTSGSASIHANVYGNSIANPGTFAAQGIFVAAGASSGDSGTMCLDIGGAGALANSFAGTGAGGTTDFRVRQRMATTIRLPGYGGTNTDTAAVIAFISGRNTGSPSGAANTNVSPGGPDGSPFGGGFIGGAACTAP